MRLQAGIVEGLGQGGDDVGSARSKRRREIQAKVFRNSGPQVEGCGAVSLSAGDCCHDQHRSSHPLAMGARIVSQMDCVLVGPEQQEEERAE